ncbi:MAG: lipoate--protein ligase family protein [Nitrospirae bacterium]|nr:MAG: lipoate--protein ligase family protein [Nitrospirota bacterium]
MLKTWRLIDSGNGAAPFNMALDEALALSVRRGASAPVLRLYGWVHPSVSLGRFQRTSDIDTGYCSARDIPVVRRPTGGRAILHDAELTYSFSVRTDHPSFAQGLRESYRKISGAIGLALQRTGIMAEAKDRPEKGTVLAGSPLCFQSSSRGEILCGSKKIVGAAQKRWTDGLLQQGTLPYRYDKEVMRSVFRLGPEIDPDQCMTGLKAVMPDLREDLLKKDIAKAFGDIFGISFVPSHPSEEELVLAHELETRKYLQDSWTLWRQ